MARIAYKLNSVPFSKVIGMLLIGASLPLAASSLDSRLERVETEVVSLVNHRDKLIENQHISKSLETKGRIDRLMFERSILRIVLFKDD